MLRRNLAAFLCVVMLINSCSFFVSSRQNMSFSSEPSGATVLINGERAGTTPLQYSVKRDTESAIIIRKDGYEPLTRRTSKGLSGAGIADVIGACIWILPIFGLLSSGAWSQEPDNMAVILEPAPAVTPVR